MKKLFFSFVMLVTLVIVAGSAMAQDKWTPILNSTWTYTVGGLTSGDAVAFSINQSTTAPGGTLGGSMTGASATVNSSGEASVTIQWTASGTYDLWIVVTGQGAGTCSNQRYRQVIVENNLFNANILALGTSTSSEYPSWATATAKASDCPAFSTGANFNYTGGSDGSSYVFFRIDVAAENNGTHTWNCSVAPSSGTIEYWNGTAWSNTAPTSISDDTNSILARVTLSNVPAGQSLTTTVTATENIGNNTVPDITPGDNGATISINPMPNLGSITFN